MTTLKFFTLVLVLAAGALNLTDETKISKLSYALMWLIAVINILGNLINS